MLFRATLVVVATQEVADIQVFLFTTRVSVAIWTGSLAALLAGSWRWRHSCLLRSLGGARSDMASWINFRPCRTAAFQRIQPDFVRGSLRTSGRRMSWSRILRGSVVARRVFLPK
ncbi:MAG: hypothetical protein RLY70_4614 [Planctomycetota bacterium]|jgi:hypothetical protein